jgi:antimicrobial peptide system SdpB family protein
MLEIASRVKFAIYARQQRLASTLLEGWAAIQAGRSLIALAQILILVGTDWDKLTPTIYSEPEAPTCRAAGGLSMFCVVPGINDTVIKWIIVLLLIVIVSGFLPLATSIIHAWISLSISTGIGLPDGGEQVAQVLCLIIPFLYIVHPISNGWKSQSKRPTNGTALAVSTAGWRLLAIQFAFIYLESGISKLSVDDWQNGSAMYYVFRDPSFGSSGWIGEIALYFSDLPLVTALITWGTIVGEVAIGVCILIAGNRTRLISVIMIVALHVGIIVTIGLWSFGAIMIAGGLLACVPLCFRSEEPSANAYDGNLVTSEN